MDRNFIGVLLVPTLLSGCMSGIRPYDGVLGYEVIMQSPSEAGVIYTDEDRFSWEKISAKATDACGKKLGADPGNIKLVILEKESLKKYADISIPIPMSAGAAGDAKSNAGSGSGPAMVIQSQSYNQSVKRLISLKKIVATCSVK